MTAPRPSHHFDVSTTTLCPLCAGPLPGRNANHRKAGIHAVGAQLYYKAHKLSWGPLRLRLFFLLLRAGGAPVSIEQIELELWGSTDIGRNLLPTNVSHLRRAMRELGMPYTIVGTPGKGRPTKAHADQPPGYALVTTKAPLSRPAGGL